MLLNQFLFLAAVLFCIGVYGVLARRNGVLVLLSVELMLNAVNINLVAFAAFTGNIAGQVFALFVITIAAAEVGLGLAIVLQVFRQWATVAVDALDELAEPDTVLSRPAEPAADGRTGTTAGGPGPAVRR